MFEGFESGIVDVGLTTIAFRRGGTGPPVLLLHGFPETHLMWHRIAPMLAEGFTVVCADLRGYGESGTPSSTPDHAPYAKSAMAADMVTLMPEVPGPIGRSAAGACGDHWCGTRTDGVDDLAVVDALQVDRGDPEVRVALPQW
jgi:haloacetate dehalogenase